MEMAGWEWAVLFLPPGQGLHHPPGRTMPKKEKALFRADSRKRANRLCFIGSGGRVAQPLAKTGKGHVGGKRQMNTQRGTEPGAIIAPEG